MEELGFAIYVFIVFGVFFIGLLGFLLSFVNNKWVSGIAFYLFAAVNLLFSWEYADRYSINAGYQPDAEKLFRAYAPVICGILTLIACVQWPFARKALARTLGVICIVTLFLLSYQ